MCYRVQYPDNVIESLVDPSTVSLNQIADNLAKADALLVEIAAIVQQRSIGQPPNDKQLGVSSLQNGRNGGSHPSSGRTAAEVGIGPASAGAQSSE
jgi:hypothetical protein